MSKKIIIILSMTLLFFTACEEDDYKKAVYDNSIQSYNKYLQEHPDSENSLEIQNRKENIYYVQALNYDALTYYKEYLQKYKSGRYVVEIKKLYENKLFEIARYSDSIESYEKYLKVVPHGAKANEAKNRLALLAYYEAIAKDKVDEYERYLIKYSNSLFVDDIRKKLATLKKSIILKSKLNLETKQVKKNKITQELNGLYWNRTDKFSLISLEVLLQKDVNQTIVIDAKKQIKILIKNAKNILKDKKYEIQKVINKQSKELKFTLPVSTDVFISMTGEKSDKYGLAGAIKKKIWFDSGKLIGPTNYIAGSGIPIGGELTNMLDTKYMTLKSGNYTLNYQTDAGRAWNSFNNNPPINDKWGISLYFLEFGKDLLPQIKVINKYFKDSANKEAYISLQKLSKKSKIKSAQDKKKIKKLSAKLFDFKYFNDINDIENFKINNETNNWSPILEYVLIYKKLMRMYKDIQFSKVNVSDGMIQEHIPGWFEQSVEDEGIARTFTDENEAASAIMSGDGGYFTRVKAKQYYFSGYVENKSDNVKYNLDIRCDFNFKSITEAGVWLFKKRIEKTTIKSKHFKIKSLKPGERKAYACKIKSNSGGAINIGMIGGSTSLFINEWQVNVTELENDNISEDVITKQDIILKEAGLYTLDFNADNVVSPSNSASRVESNSNELF